MTIGIRPGHALTRPAKELEVEFQKAADESYDNKSWVELFGFESEDAARATDKSLRRYAHGKERGVRSKVATNDFGEVTLNFRVGEKHPGPGKS